MGTQGRSDPSAREGSREPPIRLIAAAAIVALILWFALANSQRVEVDFLIDSRDVLVFVIVGSAILGALADRLLVWRSRRRHA